MALGQTPSAPAAGTEQQQNQTPQQPGNFPGFNFQPGAPTTPTAPIVIPTPAPNLGNAVFADVPATAWFAPFVQNVTQRGILTVLPNGNFHTLTWTQTVLCLPKLCLT